MEESTLYIKNMVCNRCVMVVRGLLQEMGLAPVEVTLGRVVLSRPVTEQERGSLADRLRELGFELIDTPRERLVGQVKALIIELVHRDNGDLKVNLSDYIGSRLNHDYGYVSALFSDAEGVTVEKYFIAQKIERVKELLEYGEMSLSEIAGMMNYSSVAHLSTQFKNVTGMSPSEYRRAGCGRRPLDEV